MNFSKNEQKLYKVRGSILDWRTHKGLVDMGKYLVWLKVNERLVRKEVVAEDVGKAKEMAVKESSRFGGKVEVVSVS